MLGEDIPVGSCVECTSAKIEGCGNKETGTNTVLQTGQQQIIHFFFF